MKRLLFTLIIVFSYGIGISQFSVRYDHQSNLQDYAVFQYAEHGLVKFHSLENISFDC